MNFKYQNPFPMSKDKTEYRLLTRDFVTITEFAGKKILKISVDGLNLLANEAMKDISFLLRPSHQALVGKILNDQDASDNDQFVARVMLKNAVISAERKLPFCQDTGTAIVFAKKGQQVWTDGNDAEALSNGIFKTYADENLRYSQVVPISMYDEKNSGNNLPAQIDIMAVEGDEYKFLFMAKGGGSSNKFGLFQMTKSVLNPESLQKFLTEKMHSLGTAACPPYHLAFVIGGTSAESTMKTVKLATTGYYDNLPAEGNDGGQAFRDLKMEQFLLEESRKIGYGAQFGGKYFLHDVRVVRLPRHGASCPIGMGVSCSADRNILAKINSDGIWLESLELDPAKFLSNEEKSTDGVAVNIDQPMDEIRRELTKFPVRTMVLLSGKMVVARDIAHAKLKELLDNGKPLPEYFKRHPVYYAGPAKTPEGMATGSFGPTTAQRMDPYVDLFQKNGGSMVMIAKGNRTQIVTDACRENGGFYLGSIGGPAALLAKENIKFSKVIDFPELGMEAVWEIEVENFPAFILVDDKGIDFFQQL
ncbi:MAG: fumarate hydratase [Candidatus Marinimicrobia bacterium]|nr:fumarate hydratase [Candidatus Neomarinimicrobiota bacterium]